MDPLWFRDPVPCGRRLRTAYPGAAEAYDRATAANLGFVLAASVIVQARVSATIWSIRTVHREIAGWTLRLRREDTAKGGCRTI
jgi:hypothetical protein